MSKPTVETLALLQAVTERDRTVTAATVLVEAFRSEVAEPYPWRRGGTLGLALLRSAGMDGGKWTWNIDRQPDASVALLVLECVLLWEKAGLACRGLAITENEVVLLTPGRAALLSPDPFAAVLQALRSPR